MTAGSNPVLISKFQIMDSVNVTRTYKGKVIELKHEYAIESRIGENHVLYSYPEHILIDTMKEFVKKDVEIEITVKITENDRQD